MTDGKDIVERRPYEQTPPQIAEPQRPDDAIIQPDEKFARALIGQHQQIILKAQRAIDDIKRHFGLKE